LINLLGGNIHIESEENKGTIVEFTVAESKYNNIEGNINYLNI